MGKEELVVLDAWFSPYAYRVHWALKLKGLQYEAVEVDIYDKSPLLLNYNPVLKKVPVLIHHGKPIVDSLMIIEYIDETWKHNPILPPDPYEKAMARFWAAFIEDKLHRAVRRAKVFEGDRKERELERAREALEVLERQLIGKKFFGGEFIGFVDIVLGWITHWLAVFEEVANINIMDGQKYPLLDEWMKNFLDLQVIKETPLPPKEMLITFIGSYGEVKGVSK